MHCRADRGHCGGTERPWPLSRGRIAMEACARCFLSLWRVARRTLQASGLCVEFPCLMFFSRSVLRSVCPGLVTLRDTTCRPSARIPGGYTAPSSGIRTRCRSSGGLRRYADTRLRWRGTRNYAGRCGHSRVAGWSVTALRSKNAMPTSSSKNTGVSSWTLATSTVSTQTFLLRQFSTSSHVSVRSQTRRTDLLLTRQHHRRQLDGEEQENLWKSDWGTRPGRSATDKDWPRQEDGLPRNADTQRRHCGRQPQSRSWTSRAGTARQHFSHVWPWVKSQSRRLRKRQWRDSRSKSSEHWQSRVFA